MKLNFWQWLGVVVVVIALIFIIRRETAGPDKPTRSTPIAPTTSQPTP